MNRSQSIASLGIGICWLMPALAAFAQDPRDQPSAEQLFATSVWPLLNSKCLACHGDDPKKIRGGLDLRSRDGMLRGGDSGLPALAPGEPQKSRIYLAVMRTDPQLRMPPKETDRLAPSQQDVLRQWIAGGAPWTSTKAKTRTAGVEVATSGGRTEDWTHRKYQPDDLWAYQPIRRPEPPRPNADARQLHNPIDSFVQVKLLGNGVKRLAPPADRRTLLRRAVFDLTGLPPNFVQIESFVNDNAPHAFAKVVERLLASPHYGEQMARHWLDVARYADTSGFSNDFERPNAWRYRDYVARSFNADKPFNRFIIEQLAGDELDASDPEHLIAVGFLRLGPWEHTGMTVAAVTRQQFLDDVTHHVGVTFLGQGLRCAACHDHKFDPIPTKDYYRLQAVFATTHFAERRLAFQPSENTHAFASGQQQVEDRLRETNAVLENIRRKNDVALTAYLKEQGVKSYQQLPQNERRRRDNIGLNLEDISIRKINEKRRQYFERERLRYEPYAFSAYSGPANNYNSVSAINPVSTARPSSTPDVYVLVGGALSTPAEAVTPGALSAIAEDRDALPESASGRRLALARWIASPRNPLTARVIVNRVWQWHFGRGLVDTPNNFGKMGGRPTHPELLDWLATWFIDHGWSLKQLHRLIMSSAVYQQAGAHTDMATLLARDSKNDWRAYFPARRLAAEEIRDSMLAATGELNRAVGGPGVFPEIHWEVARQPRHIMGSVAPAYQPSPTPAERNRRTLYSFRLRTLADPLLEVLNRPGSETSCERRDQTTVTPQALALLNGDFVRQRALALAAAVDAETKQPEEQIRLIFARLFGRAASAQELKDCAIHLQQMTEHHERHLPKETPLPTSVRRHMVEEMTGKDFFWDEHLDGMARYQRDLQPWQVSARVRALAEICLVMFNANEFMYVR